MIAQVWHVIINLNLKDVIDILVVSVIIYNIFQIVKGTRAVQMLVGFLVLLILFWLSHSYQLYSLNWILNNFFEYFFLIFVILFQDQVRSALINFGDTTLFNRRSMAEYDEAIEEVVEAISALSKKKMGALIVFERTNGLLNYTDTGTRLDCEIHSDVLYALFQNHSPLHDGAAILRGNKIQAAGCFLPLAKNVDIDRGLGTRHRAALGLSELSDAVIVIVSEETGGIKLCFNGIFYQMENQKILRRQLKLVLKTDMTPSARTSFDREEA